MLAINGMPDHIHFLIGMKPSYCLSDLVRKIKKSSNNFIREENLSKFRFNWHEGFGAFFIQSFSAGYCNKIYYQSKRTSQEKNIQRRISRLFKKIQYELR